VMAGDGPETRQRAAVRERVRVKEVGCRERRGNWRRRRAPASVRSPGDDGRRRERARRGVVWGATTGSCHWGLGTKPRRDVPVRVVRRRGNMVYAGARWRRRAEVMVEKCGEYLRRSVTLGAGVTPRTCAPPRRHTLVADRPARVMMCECVRGGARVLPPATTDAASKPPRCRGVCVCVGCACVWVAVDAD